MDGLVVRLRTRLLPALLTAAGVACPDGRADHLHGARGGRPRADRDAHDRDPAAPTIGAPPRTPPADELAPSGRPTETPGPDRSPPTASPRGSWSPALGIDLPIVRPGQRRPVPPVQRRDVHPGPLGQPGFGPGDVPLRPRPRGHVPADPRRRSKVDNGAADAGHDRRGLHERRPALPVRDHPGPAPPARPRRRRERDDGADVAPDLGGAEGHRPEDAGRGPLPVDRPGRPRGRAPGAASPSSAASAARQRSSAAQIQSILRSTNGG